MPDVGDAIKNKELLTSAAVSALGAVAAAKTPDLIRRVAGSGERSGEDAAEKLGEKAAGGAKEELGERGGIAGKALSKALGGGGGGTKKTRRLPIQRWTDVAAPIDRVYREWNEFDRFPQFMHRVLNVEQKGDDRVSWQEKIWFSRRQWEGRVTEQRKNDRVVWKTTSGMSHRGVVSFHRLADNLTRVMVTMEFEPNGMVEKMASGLRFVKRAVQADLARFKAQVEMGQSEGIEYREGHDDDESDGGTADEPVSRDRRSDREQRQDRESRERRRKERRRAGGRR